jgi:vitamin B12 transporter
LEADAAVAGGEGPASYAVSGAWRRMDGLYPVNSGYENANLAGRIRIEPASGTSVDFTVRTVNATYRYPTDGAGNVVDTNQHQLTRTTTLGLSLEQRFHERVRGRLALRSHAIGGGLDDAPDGPGDTLGAYAYRSQRELDRRLADLSAEWLAAPGLTLTAGAVYEHQRDRSSDEGQTEFGAYGSATDVRRHNWAAYGEAAATRGPATLTLGGRLDENERFGTFVTWRAGLSARSSFGLRAFGSAGTGFKEPTFFEQFGGSFVVGNPDLSPERATSWELGLEQMLAPAGVTVSASWFGQRFRDMIQYSYTPVTPGGANYVNLAAANADGLEVEATAIPLAGVRLTAQYTYLHTEVTDAGALPEDDAAFRQGDRLLRRPTHAAAATLGWEARVVGAHAAIRWTGDRADADFSTTPAARVELPPYTAVDAGITVRPFIDRAPLAGTAVELQVRNVFDADYQMAYGFPAMGRVVLVGVRVGRDN